MTHKPSTARPAWQVSVIVIGAFFVIWKLILPLARLVIFPMGNEGTWQFLWGKAGFFNLGAMVLLAAIPTALLVGRKNVLKFWGLDKSPWRALSFVALCTLPLPLTYIFAFPLSDVSTLFGEVLHGAIVPGITEEIWFRCFLFGLLFRVAKWGFLPAALLGAIIFGVAHLSQGKTVLEAAGVFGITAAASLWWAWIYVEWDYNAWVPIGFHVFINACFEIFTVSENALLPMTGEIARALVLVISVVLTIWMRRRQGGRKITGRRWIKPPLRAPDVRTQQSQT